MEGDRSDSPRAKKINWELWREWLGVVGFLIGFLSFLSSIYFFAAEQRTQYSLNQLTYRPNLIVATTSYTPKLIAGGWIIDSTKKPPLELATALILEVTFEVVNVGNSKAELISQLYSDTTSGTPTLEDIVLGDKNAQLNFFGRPYFGKTEINPGDSANLFYRYPINYYRDESFSIHAMILYQNELKQLFNSYYIERFKINRVNLALQASNDQKSVLITTSDSVANFIQSLDHNNSTYCYTKKERKLIKETFESRGWQ